MMSSAVLGQICCLCDVWLRLGQNTETNLMQNESNA